MEALNLDPTPYEPSVHLFVSVMDNIIRNLSKEKLTSHKKLLDLLTRFYTFVHSHTHDQNVF